MGLDHFDDALVQDYVNEAVSSALTNLEARPAPAGEMSVVLGSGWGGLTAHLRDPIRIPYASLEGFPQVTVAGHSGELWLGTLGAQPVAVMSGRSTGTTLLTDS